MIHLHVVRCTIQIIVVTIIVITIIIIIIIFVIIVILSGALSSRQCFLAMYCK